MRSYKNIACGLKGIYQQKNISSVLLAAAILNYLGYEITSRSIAKGLKEVCTLTGFRGRWEVLSAKPMIVADIAHNEAGIKEVLRQVKTIPHKKLHIVFGMVNDKDQNKIFPLLPKNAIYYFCKANIPRALDESVLASEAKRFGLTGKTFGNVKEAFYAAKKNASWSDFVLITGSTFVVAEVI